MTATATERCVPLSTVGETGRRDLLGQVFGGRRNAVRRLDILGVGVDDILVPDAIALLRAAVSEARTRTVFIANAHTLNLAVDDPTYRQVLNEADFLFGDGTGVRWAARLRGIRMRANLNGTDLVPAFMAACEGDGLRYFLLGARPEVLARTVAEMRLRWPGWTLAGHHDGYLDGAASERVVAAITVARPHLLLVGMGNPHQERWIAQNRHRLAANLCIGVGGLFSYLSGDYRRAPAAMRRLGLEWLAVMVTQRQKRGRYLRGNPVFLFRVLKDRLRPRRRGGSLPKSHPSALNTPPR